MGLDVVAVGGVLHVGSAGIDEVAGDLVGVAVFFELHAEVRGVGGVFFVVAEVRRGAQCVDTRLGGAGIVCLSSVFRCSNGITAWEVVGRVCGLDGFTRDIQNGDGA